MAGNTIGTCFRLTTFGESHGKFIGGVIDGCPSGLYIDEDFVQSELNRRKPTNYSHSTSRIEEDKVVFISGIFKNKTSGAPIAFLIENKDTKPEDYCETEDKFRPSHADFTYFQKYRNYDFRGGGRASARETASRVVAGAIAKIILEKYKIDITAYVQQIGNIKLTNFNQYSKNEIESSPVKCPDKEIAAKMVELIDETSANGDTLGGIIFCSVQNCPIGLGEPVFDKLQADLAKAMLSINAAKGFEYGSGFKAAEMKGSEHNDIFDSMFSTKTNNSGGIQGGISNRQEIYFRVAFKPASTIMQPQETIDKSGEKTIIIPKGRHDICVLPRAVPIVEAMTAIIITDHLLKLKTMIM